MSEETSLVRASDLVGCRYRLRQRIAHPEIPPLPEAERRQPLIDAGRAAVFTLLPVRRAMGDGRRKPFSRVDIDPAADVFAAEGHTRAALAKSTTLITNGALTGTIDGVPVVAEIDILARLEDGTYLPVVISNHRVARSSPSATLRFIPTRRLGLGKPLEVGAKLRHHTIDGYRAALAHILLDDLGYASGQAAAVGQDRERAYLTDVSRYVEALRTALALSLIHI